MRSIAVIKINKLWRRWQWWKDELIIKVGSSRLRRHLLPTLIPLSGVGTTCFHHVAIRIRHLFLRPAGLLCQYVAHSYKPHTHVFAGSDAGLYALHQIHRSIHQRTIASLVYFCFGSSHIIIIIIIINLLQSTAWQRPLQCLAISLDLRLLASSSCQLSYANRHSTWPEAPYTTFT
jgi:hypothetical protein